MTALQDFELQARDWQWRSVIHPDDVAAVFATWEKRRIAPCVGEVEARMRRHDGQLWASANDGAGSTFSFAISCAPAALTDTIV